MSTTREIGIFSISSNRLLGTGNTEQEARAAAIARYSVLDETDVSYSEMEDVACFIPAREMLAALHAGISL